MRLTHFFVERPIFATVIAIVITLVGAFSYPLLPVAQFPQLAPPTINVSVPSARASPKNISKHGLARQAELIIDVAGRSNIRSEAGTNGTYDNPVPFR